MKSKLTSLALALCAMTPLMPAQAVDFAYFQRQSCDELADEYGQLTKAQKAADDAMQKEKSDATKSKALGIASAFLLGFGWWKEADHSNTNLIQAEIRDDMRMVTRAAKEKKCQLPS